MSTMFMMLTEYIGSILFLFTIKQITLYQIIIYIYITCIMYKCTGVEFNIFYHLQKKASA